MGWKDLKIRNGEDYSVCPFCGRVWIKSLTDQFIYCPSCGQKVKEDSKIEEIVKERFGENY